MTVQPAPSALVFSIYDEARKEAEIHKWIESQKHGRDLGDRAIEDWYRAYWFQYCRHRRLEHLSGRRCWREFNDEKFGCLYSLIVMGDPLVNRILDKVYAGSENLQIINWGLDISLPMDRVIDILAQIDVNRGRLPPRNDRRN